MQLEERREGDVLILTPTEDALDAYTAPALRRALAARTGEGWRRIVLDLSRVRFLDSTALGALVSAYKAMGTGGAFVLCGLDHFVLDVFRLTRMDELFPIESGIEAAVTRCRAQARAA